MDIGALLVEADEETYESDTDRNRPQINTETPSNNDESNANLLKLAAQKVAHEQIVEEEKVFENITESFISEKNSLKQEQSTIVQKDVNDLLESNKGSTKVLKVNNEQLVLSKDADEDYNDDAEYETNDAFDDEANPRRQQDNPSDDEGEDDNDDDEGAEDPNMDSQLFIACFRSNYDAAKNALKLGARVFGRDRHGWTPLHWAASKGAVDIMELLIDFRKHSGKKLKKYLNARDTITGWTALHVSTSSVLNEFRVYVLIYSWRVSTDTLKL